MGMFEVQDPDTDWKRAEVLDGEIGKLFRGTGPLRRPCRSGGVAKKIHGTRTQESLLFDEP